LLVFGAIGAAFKFLIRKGRQRFTVMFIPHSEKKIFNFHISVFSLIFFLCLIVVLVVSFFGLSTHFTSSSKRITRVTSNLKLAETDLDSIKEELIRMNRVWDEFHHRLNELLNVMDLREANPFLQTGAGGDLSAFLSTETMPPGYSQEIGELRSLAAYMANAMDPLAEMTKVLRSQRELLVDIPTLWPVSNGKGNITAIFGPEIHPITGSFRLHNGVDIAFIWNTPILATANGKVVAIKFDNMGLGISVRIKHKYGFSTVYAHLNQAIVKKGQEVTRGQKIGYLGNTGLSTGPHLHYEVWLGTGWVDPMLYLDIESPLVQKFSSNR
jgi:murein DD-endopeptidase MepM/ murein hydrolase activator NlpD